MPNKASLSIFVSLAKEEFITPFCFLVFIVGITIQILNLVVGPVHNSDLLLSVSIFFGGTAFLNWYEHGFKARHDDFDKKIANWLLYILILLVFIADLFLSSPSKDLSLIAPLDNSSTLTVLLTLIVVIGVFVVHRNIDSLARIINKDRLRISFFNKNYLLGTFLVFIFLIAFTSVKIPYFNSPFFGSQSKKYNTYVEPALYMVQTNNPFAFRQLYSSDPINNPEGIGPGYEHLPLLEWELATIYKISPIHNIRINTRLGTDFIGILILIATYIFFKEYTDETFALIVTGLFALDPLLIFATIVTVYDSLSLLFFLFSLIYLNRYIEKGAHKNLIWAAIYFGIGNACKYSLFLWGFPILAILMLFKDSRADWSERIYDLIIIGIVSFFFVVCTFIDLGHISVHPYISLLLIIISLPLLWFILKGLDSARLSVVRGLRNLLGKPILLISSMIIFLFLLVVLAVIIVKVFGLAVSGFITDINLIFDPNLYIYMFRNQFIPEMTPALSIMALLGVLVSFSLPRTLKVISLSFLISSVFYLIIAAESIWFQNYYALIFMLTAAVFAAVAIYTIVNNRNFLVTSILLGITLFLIVPEMYSEINTLIPMNVTGYNQLIAFIDKNTTSNQTYIASYSTNFLSIESSRPGLGRYSYLDTPEFQESIQNVGFGTTMSEYGIKYFVTSIQQPEYGKFVDLFQSSIDIPVDAEDTRDSEILETLGTPLPIDTNMDNETREIVAQYQIQNKFQLVAQFGIFRVFAFQN
jgi:hypothetical protein